MGWAGIITYIKTLLDVYLLSSNFANLILKEETATGTSTCDDYSVPSRPFDVEHITAYHPRRGLAALLILLSRQRRPDDGVSKSMTPTSFIFIHPILGAAE